MRLGVLKISLLYFALDSCSIVGRPIDIYYRKHKGFKANKSDLKNGKKINPEK